MTPGKISNPVLCFSITLIMAVCGGALSCHEQWQSEVTCVLRTSQLAICQSYLKALMKDRGHTTGLYSQKTFASVLE